MSVWFNFCRRRFWGFVVFISPREGKNKNIVSKRRTRQDKMFYLPDGQKRQPDKFREIKRDSCCLMFR